MVNSFDFRFKISSVSPVHRFKYSRLMQLSRTVLNKSVYSKFVFADAQNVTVFVIEMQCSHPHNHSFIHSFIHHPSLIIATGDTCFIQRKVLADDVIQLHSPVFVHPFTRANFFPRDPVLAGRVTTLSASVCKLYTTSLAVAKDSLSR